MKPKLPIIVRESSDLYFFETVESAELGLEPIDVLNGEYEAYDAEGRLLNLEVREEEQSMLFGLSKGPVEVTRIFCREEEPSHQKKLYNLLWEFLEGWREPIPLSSEDTLESLIKKTFDIYGYTK